jgi:hypothetical protein
MERICKQCGEVFDADEDWKRVCLPCWRENKAKEQGGKKSSGKGSSYGGKKFDKEFYDRVFGKTQAIPADMLKTLIMLCHPDKHGGKESATRATQYLLSLRGK